MPNPKGILIPETQSAPGGGGCYVIDAHATGIGEATVFFCYSVLMRGCWGVRNLRAPLTKPRWSFFAE